jgi:hypothetical protein
VDTLRLRHAHTPYAVLGHVSASRIGIDIALQNIQALRDSRR